ncbi:hypothetical protein CICLE_v10005327mg [Citrus x clementina]|uniref:MATH domain-containing protein n=1 Tax=Citrus clementina TaxID=85681 RepID=V4RF60_CITCL|nr:uncharacterized protein LOC18031348 isoform X1 [Citrus x clementina]ESR32503.1 hypothetical protein CICLE_v10005327mg [Citrus x clementina]
MEVMPPQIFGFAEPVCERPQPQCTCITTNSVRNFAAMGDEIDRFALSISGASPTHYTVKINSFSLLLKNSVEKYETGDFEAGGYKWKLVLYPAGNKSKNVKEHISVYLAMANTSSLQLGWEVYAVFRLFLLDQNKDNFLILQDAMGAERRFHRLKCEWGFDEFIPIKAFNDASNGFLLEDTCVFGAEVFVCKERSTGKGECLSMIKDAPSIKHVWRIENFSKLRSECCDSQVFNSGDQKWKIQLYPKGRRHGTGTHLAMYLALADSATLTPGSKIYAEFTVRLLDQVQARHIAGKANFWFSASNPESGWARYVSFAYFNNPGNGCLVKDVCSVEAEVTVHGVSNAL